MQTGIVYCNAREAAEAHGIKIRTLKNMLNKYNPNWTDLMYLESI